ncbi:MAG TPA: DCC1-like thiol-disulfide oxidoreductase family protein [Dehalococcoidia bacterium]|nr:DCC1-like thiol-disulfide oxidoreductase family protein [Dehalococcoidia bacterium]
MDWIRAGDPAGRVLALPNQTPGIRERFGLSKAQVDRELYAVARNRRVYHGAAAVARIFQELGGPWPAVGRAMLLPGVRLLAQGGYRWVAEHRGRFARLGSTPACARPGTPCLPEGE